MPDRYEILGGCNLSVRKRDGGSLFWNSGILKRLRVEAFDVMVVGGYNHPTMLLAMFYAISADIPFYLMCETRLKINLRSDLKSLLKGPLLRWLLRRTAGGFPTGLLAARYLESYGMSKESLHCVPNTPDVVTYRATVSMLRSQRKSIRLELGVPESAPLAVFVGRLIPKKGAHELLNALSSPLAPKELHLFIVGDGVDRGNLERLTLSLGLKNRVHFAGFVEQADLPRYYAIADLFVLPSSETWGVVVIEALSSGLPVMVSNEVGCHPDVVNDKAVGEVLPKGDIESWALALSRWVDKLPNSSAVEGAWSEKFESMRYTVVAERMATVLRNNVQKCPPTHH